MRVGWSSAGAVRREKSRILILASFILLAVIGVRLFYLQVLHAAEFRELARSNFLRPEVIQAMRGMIRDRNGVLLASSIPSFTVTIDPYNEAFRGPSAPGRPRVKLEDSVHALAALLELDGAELLAQVEKQRRNSYQPVRVRRNLDMKMVSRIAENRASLPGVAVDMEPLRSYPQGEVGAHIIGYINEISDVELGELRGQGYFPGASIGRAGLELQYEKELKGEDGIRYVEVNALGRRSNYFTARPPILPRRGRDLDLTIDWTLQKAAEAAFDSAGWSGGNPVPEARGSVVAIDPRNGEVLVLVSRPAYDPNEFASGLSNERWAEMNQPGRHPLLNRAVQSRYPPGSTFKPVTVIAGLMARKVTPSTMLGPCTGAHTYGTRVFRCWKPDGHGYTDAVRSLTVSCDVYYYQVGHMLGVNGIAEMARRMKAVEATGIDLPRERKGFVPDEAWYDRQFGQGGWSRGASLNLSIGQGEILMTPVELASFCASLATGRIPQLHLVRSMSSVDDSRPFVPETASRGALDVDPKALAVARRGMEEVVMGVEGTGKNARIDGITVAGKTGSAQHGGDPTHALFICYAPYENPEIAVAVILEARGGGGSFAAPVAHAVLDHYFHPEKYIVAPDSLAAADSTALSEPAALRLGPPPPEGGPDE